MYTKQNVPKDRKTEREFRAVNIELYAPAGSAHSKWTTSLFTNIVNLKPSLFTCNINQNIPGGIG